MKLEVGMYVRTEYGIDKIKDIVLNGSFYEDSGLYLEKNGKILCGKEAMKDLKASHNIIDLVQENDYIRIISSAFFEPVYYSYGKLVIRDDIPIENYSNKFIAEVITREQIESMSYKVGE